MSTKKFYFLTAILVALAIVIKIFSANSIRVEHNFSTNFYLGLSYFLRFIFGWLPFSLGDILYGLVGFWLLYKLVVGIKILIKRQATKKCILAAMQKLIIIVLLINIVFNIFWGINYNRVGIAKQLNLKIDSVSYANLKEITTLLITKLNATKKYLITNNIAYPTHTLLFKKVSVAYSTTKNTFPFLAYSPTSLKSSLWGWIGNYTGFTGYYNPFTGEAQVNTSVPQFLLPFIACHEVAHQLGYAKEEEANSVGYLVALHSNDSLLLYSAYFDLYNYTANTLIFQSYVNKDTAAAKNILRQLSTSVKADIKEVREFYKQHQNPIEPLIRKGYALYLKNNNQPKGIQSYDEVVNFLVAYYKKFGTL